MKKIFYVMFIWLTTITFFTGCGKDYSNYKNEEGYQEYINDSSTGYEDVPYYDCDESMETSELARKYYENNKRRSGDYIITDYNDGVCINQYVGGKVAENAILNVPEKIDGKPVVKIGGYPVDNGDDFLGAFAGNKNFTLKLPSTVKYIGSHTFLYYSGIIPEENRDDFTLVKSVEVSEDNPYYASYKGTLYTKDKKSLLYEPKLQWIYLERDYIVPELVENFVPSNGVSDGEITLTIGENVKTINTFIDKGEDGIDPNPYVIPQIVIRGKKGSVAEEWAKEQCAKFEALE